MTPISSNPARSSSAEPPPTLDAQIRERLGRQLQALYDPIIDEPMDPRLAELLRQLDHDKRQGTAR